MTGFHPIDLNQFRWIVVNSSGGKDSQTVLRQVVAECRRQEVADSKIVVSHQDLQGMEWPGTHGLVHRQAAHYGLRVEVSRYRDRAGNEIDLLDYVRRRGKWPSSQQRYCTSDFKRGPGGRVLTMLSREAEGDILNVFGFRAEESPARSKRPVFSLNQKYSTKKRRVMDWLPIHNWTEAQVWQDIRESQVPYHEAYALGMSRLSCVFCIFAPKAALIIAGKANRTLLDRCCALEQEIGHSFQNGQAIARIREAVDGGEQPGITDGVWNM